MTKVLVVDDEPSILKSTELLLKTLGFDTATASEADAVLPALRRERPDVLLQDVRMPGLDIEALVDAVRADPDVGATPVILFSASLRLPDVQEQVEADGYLEKPFTPDAVMEAVDVALGGGKGGRGT